MKILDIVIAAIAGLLIGLQLLRIIRLIFEPGFLRHRVFEFPSSIAVRVFYYLCSIIVLLLLMLIKLNKL